MIRYKNQVYQLKKIFKFLKASNFLRRNICVWRIIISILLLTITLNLTAGTKFTTEKPWIYFNKMDWFRADFSGKTSKSSASEDGWRITGRGPSVVLTQKKFQIMEYASPQAAIFDYTLHSNTPVKMWINYKTKEGTFQSEVVDLNHGRNQVHSLISNSGMVRIISLELTFDTIDLTFHQAKLEFKQEAAEAFCVLLDTPDPISIFKPNEAISLRLINYANTNLPFVLEGRLTSFYGDVIKFHHEGMTKSGESFIVPLTKHLPLQGYWRLDWTIHSGTTKAIGQTGLAVLPELPDYHYKKGDFMFGICSHPSRWPIGDRELEAKLTKRLGADFIRTTVTWDAIQPKSDPDYFDYSQFDSVVNIFSDQGIEVQGMLVFTARYAAPEELRNSKDHRAWNRAKPELEAWRRYAEKTVSRYQGKINIWEIWNEPDLWGFARFSAKDYLDIARVSNKAIRKVNPEATIFSAGFAGLSSHPNRKDPDFQLKVMRDGKQYFDVHAYHGHAAFTPFAQQIDQKLLPLRKEADVNIPWYANETAVFALNGTDHAQATTLFKKLIFCWSRGAIGYNWYNLRNKGLNLRDPENTYGMVTFEYKAKPVAAVYHTLAAYFRGAQYLKELKLPANCYAYLFRNNNNLMLAVWNESDEFVGPIPVKVEEASSIKQIDCMGNSKTLTLKNGLFMMTPSVEPMIYKMRNAVKIEYEKPLFSVVCSPVMTNRNFQFTLTATNPFSKPICLQLQLHPANGISFQPETKMVDLAPSHSTTLLFEGRTSPNALINNFILNYEIPEIYDKQNISIPMRLVTVIPSQTENNYRRKADFILNQANQVVSIGEGDPALRLQTWTGPDDLSASAWLRKGKDFLELYVRVRDDVFVPAGPGQALWKGDSIQMGLIVPGQDGGWKITLARRSSGHGKRMEKVPSGFNSVDVAKSIVITSHRNDVEQVTVYRVKFPFSALGLNEKILQDGVRFNLLLNDNDGSMRESYMQLYPGLSSWTKLNYFPLIVFE